MNEKLPTPNLTADGTKDVTDLARHLGRGLSVQGTLQPEKGGTGKEDASSSGFLQQVVGPSRSQKKILDAAIDIREHPDATEAAFMARYLVQCTLPHSNPGDVPVWTRSNGHLTLAITRAAFDAKSQRLIGYPYGSIPRLLLFWLTTEAMRTQCRKIELGDTLSAFMRAVGLNPETGGGERGDAFRLRNQMRRLFGASLSFHQTNEVAGVEGERFLDMRVASKAELWWHPKAPNQVGLWNSWVELGEAFFDAITQRPVPVDLRALKALKRSPLALDLYAWSTYKTYVVSRRGRSQFVPWRGLEKQLGADYGSVRNFKKKALLALRKIQVVYPDLRLEQESGGFRLYPSKPAIKPRPPQP